MKGSAIWMAGLAVIVLLTFSAMSAAADMLTVRTWDLVYEGDAIPIYQPEPRNRGWAAFSKGSMMTE